MATTAEDAKLLAFVDAHDVYGKDTGFVDVHLRAVSSLTAGATTWTRATGVGGCPLRPSDTSPIGIATAVLTTRD